MSRSFHESNHHPRSYWRSPDMMPEINDEGNPNPLLEDRYKGGTPPGIVQIKNASEAGMSRSRFSGLKGGLSWLVGGDENLQSGIDGGYWGQEITGHRTPDYEPPPVPVYKPQAQNIPVPRTPQAPQLSPHDRMLSAIYRGLTSPFRERHPNPQHNPNNSPSFNPQLPGSNVNRPPVPVYTPRSPAPPTRVLSPTNNTSMENLRRDPEYLRSSGKRPTPTRKLQSPTRHPTRQLPEHYLNGIPKKTK